MESPGVTHAISRNSESKGNNIPAAMVFVGDGDVLRMHESHVKHVRDAWSFTCYYCCC